MADTTALKSMLNNIINDKPEEAQVDLHSYLTGKMRETAGLASSSASETDSTATVEGESEAE